MFGNVDPDADYLYHGVCHGFDIVDPSCLAYYQCDNFDSINSMEFKSLMDVIVNQELMEDKVTRVSHPPSCIHALGGIRKSNGKLRPITDCRRPLQCSINNYMESTFVPFHYVTFDDECNELAGSEFMAVVDIKSAYRSINISAAHRKFQGFRWQVGGQMEYFTDNCLSFGLRCAPSIFTRFTEFIVRCMSRRGFKHVYGYIDDFLVVGSTLEECNQGLVELSMLLRSLGFYVSWEKIEPPSQVTKYLDVI